MNLLKPPVYDKRLLSSRRNTFQPLPTKLRRGMEALTGVDLRLVRVFYCSSKPKAIQAHAFAQGWNIYLGPNQEHHLPHELGHIVQQALGKVKPTGYLQGIAINDDPVLEQQATELGKAAIKIGYGIQYNTQ